VSYPSFHNYIRFLRALLRRKHSWLLEESVLLADLCLAYSSLVNMPEQDRKVLFLAAHFKNLGAIYVDSNVLQQEFTDPDDIRSHMELLFMESAQLARDSGLVEVTEVLEQYHLRAIPPSHLARIFQVLNTWVSCRQRKGWRSPMSDHEALIVLKQRAELKWSDPKVVFKFIDHLCRYADSPGRRPAKPISGLDLPLPAGPSALRREMPPTLPPPPTSTDSVAVPRSPSRPLS